MAEREPRYWRGRATVELDFHLGTEETPHMHGADAAADVLEHVFDDRWEGQGRIVSSVDPELVVDVPCSRRRRRKPGEPHARCEEYTAVKDDAELKAKGWVFICGIAMPTGDPRDYSWACPSCAKQMPEPEPVKPPEPEISDADYAEYKEGLRKELWDSEK